MSQRHPTRAALVASVRSALEQAQADARRALFLPARPALEARALALVSRWQAIEPGHPSLTGCGKCGAEPDEPCRVVDDGGLCRRRAS